MSKAETELNKLIDDIITVFPFIQISLDPISINGCEKLKIVFVYKGEHYCLSIPYSMAKFEYEDYKITMREGICVKIMNLIWEGDRVNG